MRKWKQIVLCSLAALGISCSESQDSKNPPSLMERGKHYYKNVCTACHNGDPSKDGTLGPAVAGSDAELIDLIATAARRIGRSERRWDNPAEGAAPGSPLSEAAPATPRAPAPAGSPAAR